MPARTDNTIREAVGFFQNIDDLNEAVAELESTAFQRHDISVLAGRHDLEEKYGMSDFPTQMVEHSPSAPRAILIRPEEKTIFNAAFIGGGVYAGVVTALAISSTMAGWSLYGLMIVAGIAGGILGGIVSGSISNFYNSYLQNQAEHGGIVLWVRTLTPSREDIACRILKKHGGRRVHVQNIT